ncbi:Fe-S cluster assembly protein SufD [Agaribacterium sp. ZY112]|uniref:Fe-S cluster assembly protein SufD n=1 Tax=Agaribacterium sp. ZY112 TaxID=3233574 RepID=UPI0035257E05
MTDFLSSAQSALSSELAFISEARAQAAELVAELSLPSRKTEDWKYTSVASLKKRTFYSQQGQLAEVNVAELSQLAELDAYRLVFVNGQLLSSESVLPEQEGVELSLFSAANSEQQALIAKELNSCFEPAKHRFAALNTASFNEGVLLHIKRSVKLDKPLHIIQLSTQAASDFAVSSRVLVVLEANAEAELIEQFSSSSDKQVSFTNNVSEFVIADNAKLQHYRLQDEQEDAVHVGAAHARLARNARLNSFYLTLGSVLKRVDMTVTYEGEGAEAELNGVYLPQNKQHVDVHSTIEHAVPHCQTNEVFRGIIADEARAVFNGRIHIHPDAQKTEAYLSNKNLLTSNKAEVDTKPELEIYADDVRCAHGATVAQLDDMAMHYLRTRGVAEAEAKVLLSFGFINELLEEIDSPLLLTWARNKLTSLFSRDPELTRHLL